MVYLKKLLPVIAIIFLSNVVAAQQTPLNPPYYWVFTPYVYNPAVSGSKDFISADFITAFRGKTNTQLLAASGRLAKSNEGYFSSSDLLEFKNLGLSGTLFRDNSGTACNLGFSAAASYQIPLDQRKVTFLSVGASFKGVFNTMKSYSDATGSVREKTFYPNADLGIYFYGPSFYTGVSVVDIAGTPKSDGTLGIPVERSYFFSAGYKFVISRPMNIVIEPALLSYSTDNTFKYIIRNTDPILKLYVDNLCVGSYFFTGGSAAFFARYNYPGFYVGTFFELPQKSAYYRSNPTVEFTFGMNIQAFKSRLSKTRHW